MALRVLPHTEGISWQDWVDTIVGYNEGLRNQVDPNQGWEAFADRMSLIEPATPRAEFFDTWQAWATALKRTLQV